MSQKWKATTWISQIVLLMLIAGCDDHATRVAHEAANRQAQQNTSMAELNKEVASGTHQLVAADAQTRREIISVHHDLAAERMRLDTGWKSLEQERRQIAGERRTESILAPAIQTGGLVALVCVLLGFCWYAVGSSRNSDGSVIELNELLVHELHPDEATRLFASRVHPMMDRSR